MLDRVLRRCPLTPAEVACIEHALPPLMEGSTPATLTPLFLAALQHRPAAQRAQVQAVLQVLKPIRQGTKASQEESGERPGVLAPPDLDRQLRNHGMQIVDG